MKIPASVLELLPALIAGYVRLVGRTSHWSVEGWGPVSTILENGENLIFAFWHNRFPLMPYYYCDRIGRTRIAVMVSQSRDGQLVEWFLDRFHFRSVRGSSSRGGRRALAALLRLLREGWDIALTPDGPRGPRYQVQDGVIALASASGVPVVPVSVATSLRVVFGGSWDHFRLPLPASRIGLAFAEPLYIPPDPGGEQREFWREELRRRLRQADQQAEMQARG